MDKKFKYQSQMEELNELGLCCPPENLFVPDKIVYYRFVFDDINHKKNHKPPGINNPKRLLKEQDSKKCSLYGLSCFSKEIGAKSFYVNITNSIPNIHKSIGNTLSIGHIQSVDGLITEEDSKTHFDLFEYESCDLNKSFSPKEKLM